MTKSDAMSSKRNKVVVDVDVEEEGASSEEISFARRKLDTRNEQQGPNL
jgi:hypothetical protein